ncbi:MAG: hypothetical protein WC522_00255 [Candidatus Omnitrophota bacterium]
MQAIYISNTKKDGKLFAEVKKLLQEKEAVPEPQGIHVNIFYNNHHLSYYQSGNDFVANNGTFVYKDLFNKRALEVFYADLMKGQKLSELLSKAHGQFFLVAHLAGKLYVATDKLRTIPIFILRANGAIEISNLYHPLSRNPSVKYTVSFDHLAQQLSFNGSGTHLFTGETLYNEIAYLDAGTIFTVEKDNVGKELYYNIKKDIEFGKYKSLPDVIDAVAAELEKNYKFLDSVDRVFCGVTGGYDTRFNLDTVLKKKKNFACGNMILEREWGLRQGKFSDFNITKKIARVMGLEYKNFGVLQEDIDNWVDQNRVFIESHKDTAGSSHRYYYYNSVSKEFDIELTGMGGTELLNKFSNEYYRKGGRFDIDEFLAPQKYNDILQDRYYDGRKYKARLREYVSDLLDGITYSSRGDLFTYIIYEGTYRSFQDEYVGAINMFCTAYSPYLEPGFVKIMLETPYRLKGFHMIQRHIYARIMDKRLANIDTTHGYPPTTIGFKNFYRFLRLLNPIEPSLQYYGLLNRLRIIYGKYLYNMNRPELYDFGSDNPVYKYIDRDKLNKRRLFTTTNSLTNWVSRYAKKLPHYDI